MKYLVVGLGNIGPEYQHTRHNIGFRVLDVFAKASNAVFEDSRYGAVTTVGLKGRSVVLLKPSTYMNLSGKAVSYAPPHGRTRCIFVFSHWLSLSFPLKCH